MAGEGNPASHQLMIASCDTMEGQCLRVLGLHGDGGLPKIRQKVLIAKLFCPTYTGNHRHIEAVHIRYWIAGIAVMIHNVGSMNVTLIE